MLAPILMQAWPAVNVKRRAQARKRQDASAGQQERLCLWKLANEDQKQ